LLMADHTSRKRFGSLHQRNVVPPEMMSGVLHCDGEIGERFSWRDREHRKCRVGDDTHEPGLRDRTSGPSCGSMPRKPTMRSSECLVLWPTQRDQHVNIEQSDHY